MKSTLANGAELTTCEKSVAKYGNPPTGWEQHARNQPYEGENQHWFLGVADLVDGTLVVAATWFLECLNCPTAYYTSDIGTGNGTWQMHTD